MTEVTLEFGIIMKGVDLHAKFFAILGSDQLFADTDNTTLDHQNCATFGEFYGHKFSSLHH
jgi:hypothetical protein